MHFYHSARGKQQHVKTALQREWLLLFFNFVFPCRSKPLWVRSSVCWHCQSSLLTKGLQPGCSPQPASFNSPGALGSPGMQTGGSFPSAAAESTTESKAGLSEQRVLQRRTKRRPVVLWYSPAQRSHIISTNITSPDLFILYTNLALVPLGSTNIC